jgi:hypothetical protein
MSLKDAVPSDFTGLDTEKDNRNNVNELNAKKSPHNASLSNTRDFFESERPAPSTSESGQFLKRAHPRKDHYENYPSTNPERTTSDNSKMITPVINTSDGIDTMLQKRIVQLS